MANYQHHGRLTSGIPSDPVRVRAVLQAGGKGERMKSHTIPKALQTVGGVPMLDRLVYQLIRAGIRHITIITGWLGGAIEAHVRRMEGLSEELRVDFLRELTPLGNVGSLRLLSDTETPVLLVFADLVTDLDFAKLVAVHRERRAAVSLASHHETHRVRLGELIVEGDHVLRYLEKPEKRFVICSGIAVFEPQVLTLIPPDRPSGLSDLVTAAISNGYPVTHWAHGSAWMDVNTAEELANAETLYRSE